MVFREIAEVSIKSNQTSLRDNMVSGIDGVKLDSESTFTKSAINMEVELTSKEVKTETKVNGSTLGTNHSRSSSPPNLIKGQEEKGNAQNLKEPPVPSDPVINSANETAVNEKQPDKDSTEMDVCVAVDATKTDSAAQAEKMEVERPAVVIGVKRKRANSEDMLPPNAPRKIKLQPAPEVPGAKPPKKDIPSLGSGHPNVNGINSGQLARATPPASNSATNKQVPHARRLVPMRIDSVFSCKVNTKREVNYSLEVENVRKGVSSSVLRCKHEEQSFHGLEWSIATDSPVCGVLGDMFRIIAICEDNTVHVLDLKGRYAFPPLVIPSHPSKIGQNGPYLMVITVKGTVHVWNVHSKKILIKTESVLPLLNQPGHDQANSLDVSYASVMANGVPLVILSNGKTFLFCLDMQAWMVISDPSTPIQASRKFEDIVHQEPLFSHERKKPGNQQHAVITAAKLKLASATELRKPVEVRKWILILAKSFANYGLRQELHQLCEDLLGPTHSSARASSSWSSTVGGVDKRDLLREILTVLLEDLRWQDFYCEFNDLLSSADDSHDHGHFNGIGQ